jgi:hypothetical protein
MRLSVAAALGAALLAAPAFAADNEAGVPLAPADAAGPWTLETGGHNICVLSLGERKSSAGYALTVPATCGGALPAGLAGWNPTAHGMSLVSADGQTQVGFSRWSNSLLVSHHAGAVDIQLHRGAPSPG